MKNKINFDNGDEYEIGPPITQISYKPYRQKFIDIEMPLAYNKEHFQFFKEQLGMRQEFTLEYNGTKDVFMGIVIKIILQEKGIMSIVVRRKLK